MFFKEDLQLLFLAWIGKKEVFFDTIQCLP